MHGGLSIHVPPAAAAPGTSYDHLANSVRLVKPSDDREGIEKIRVSAAAGARAGMCRNVPECADGRRDVIIRGPTIDPLVRGFERLFNTSVLDTVRRGEEIQIEERKQEEEVEGGRDRKRNRQRRKKTGKVRMTGQNKALKTEREHNGIAMVRKLKRAEGRQVGGNE
ncbi:hypothetical protein EYF80_024877 [Liparis tanakae]|uniref:Uncharacterized protein n=1 Tax=Liparis tanakae TaxID=230148 RepID=A0A4Z2HG89_9TELE|nr:hypothetical protein EYF80_024877 [Liparis tanakae]